MLRDPRDVMISRYHFLKAKKISVINLKNIKKKKSNYDSFTDFILNPKFGFESFFKHYNSWKDKANIIIKYEEFKKRPQEKLSYLLKNLNLNIDQNTIIEAIKKSDIQSVRKFDNIDGHTKLKKFKNGFKFTRDGSIEQWKKIFSETQIEIYKKYVDKYNFIY